VAPDPDDPVTQGGRRLRVAVFDRGSGQEEWLSVLARESVDLVRAKSLKEIASTEADHIVAWVTPEEAASLAGELARHPKAPPVTMMTGATEGEHPQTRLMKTLVGAKREWEATFDAILDPLAIVDTAGVVRRANLSFARVLGKDIREVVSRSYSSLLGPPGSGFSDPVATSLGDRAARTDETRYEALASIQLVTVSPWRDAGGGLCGFVVLLKDLGQQKEQQRRLQQAARLADIGQLAAGVAHEINTPLASIALRAESLLRSTQDPSLTPIEAFKNFPRYLKTIEEETFRCKKIIRALLEFSSSRKPETRPVDVNGLAERAADLVGHQMKLKQVSLSLRLEPGLDTIHADDGQLRQVLLALLMNALDATSAGGHIEVETRRGSEGGAILSVKDDGIGMPPEVRDKIFSPFFTTKPFGEGTGLGLAICHGIVTSHGGTIQVESEAGKGSRICVVLPPQAPAGAR
jgi:two-component system, NtrC family, sensor kinase